MKCGNFSVKDQLEKNRCVERAPVAEMKRIWLKSLLRGLIARAMWRPFDEG
jgi:hypothetical protein